MASRMLGISLTTLSIWTRKGLLRPVRAVNGWRYFGVAEIERLAKRRAKQFGR
jgi:DNA-binding transcriptional MerR regulator